jgi:hypothetical protein
LGDERPIVDERDPGVAIQQMVEHVLMLAESWVGWDGKPAAALGRQFTPHKAIRRVADHMLDHLAQLEAHLAGIPSLADEWHGSAITTDADMAPFRQEDLDEARSRLERLAEIWRVRLLSVPSGEMDTSEQDAYTPREIAFCAIESGTYADAVGSLGPTGSGA